MERSGAYIMERSILYSRNIISDIELEYYIISEDIAKAYCSLKYYGAKIIKTVRRAEGKTVESTQINNIFYRRDDIEDFVRRLVLNNAEPSELKAAAEKCIADSVKKAKKSA